MMGRQEPRGTSADGVELRQAAAAGAELDPKSGSEAQAISKAILATPPDVINSAIAVSK
jgi:hypothetical protein